MLGRLLAGWLVVHAGCATFTSQSQIIESPAGTRHVDRVVPDSRTYSATAEVDGTQLVVTVSQQDRCEQAEIPLVHRVRITKNTEVPHPIGLRGEILAAVTTVVLGAAMIAAPQRVCSWNNDDGTHTEIEPATCTAAGWGMISLSGVLTAAAVADTLKSRDEQEDLGIHEAHYTVTPTVCRAGPVAQGEVSLQLRDTELPLRSTTSDTGVATFSLTDAASDALPHPDRPALLAIGTATTPVALTSAQHSTLSANRRAVPGTRLFLDAEATARALIASQTRDVISALVAGTIDQADQMLGAATPALIDALRREPGITSLRRLVGESALELSQPTDLQQAQQHFCRARRMFIRVHSQADWRALQPEIARNVGDLAKRPAATIESLMRSACPS